MEAFDLNAFEDFDFIDNCDAVMLPLDGVVEMWNIEDFYFPDNANLSTFPSGNNMECFNLDNFDLPVNDEQFSLDDFNKYISFPSDDYAALPVSAPMSLSLSYYTCIHTNFH